MYGYRRCVATTPRDLPRDIGTFIRDLRRNARISLRQLADQTGVSNPYLSQIERGLRKPSAEVLQQIASALRVSTPVMYLRAGLLDAKDGQGVLAAIATDPDLTVAQKQSLSQIYETFRRENARTAAEHAGPAAGDAEPAAQTAKPATVGSEAEEIR
jgi:transcriptional regulator with XRE-family HTH domain